MRTKKPYNLTTKAYPFETQRNDECSIHAFNNIVALTTSKEFAQKRRDVPITPMDAELSTEACRIAKAAFPEFRNDTYAVCASADIPRYATKEERGSMIVETSHRTQTVFMFYEIWNLCNPEMPRLRTTEPIMHDASIKTDDETGLEVARMFEDIHVIGAQVGVIVLGKVEHYVAVVRMDEGFVLVESMNKKTDKLHVGKVKGLRPVKLKERKMPFVSSASEIHNMVMELYPDIQSTIPHSDDLRMYPNKPVYSFVFTESPHTMPWYRAYIEKPLYADLASYMMPDKGILKAIADSMKRCLHKYTDVDSVSVFVGDLKARMSIDGELDETDTDVEVVKDTLTDTPPKKTRKRTGKKKVVAKATNAKRKRAEFTESDSGSETDTDSIVKSESEDEDFRRALKQSKQRAFEDWAFSQLEEGKTLSNRYLRRLGIVSFGRIMGIASGRYQDHRAHSSRFRVIK